MKRIDISVGALAVEWMTGADAPEQLVALCERAGLPESSFPSVERLRTLRARNPDIIAGVYSQREPGGARTLVGAAVILPITAPTASKLEDGRIDSGKKIGANELRRSWRAGARGDDLYISVLVADPAFRRGVVEAGARVLAVLQGPRAAFTRASTAEGRTSSTRLGFSPIPSTTNSIWIKRPATAPITLRGQNAGTLAAYDKRLRAISATARIARPALYLLCVAAIVALCALIFSHGQIGRALTQSLDLVPAQVTPVMTTAATLGGLALTVFFLTAQLRMSGISQYGMTAIYRVRDVTPLVVLTGLTVLSGAFVLVAGPGIAREAVAVAAGVAVISNAFLIALIVLLSLELIRNLDPVAVARRFASTLRGENADEWGLVQVRQSTGDTRLDVELRKNRTNFGLRDPLMPIHEIHLAAVHQRYGQVLGVLAEQIARAYGCPWRQQFPDSGAWPTRPLDGRWSRLRSWARSLRVKRGWQAERDRLQLAMLILHYVKRIHRNQSIQKVPEDYRRQSALFVMSRLIVVLASGIPAWRVSNEETSLVLRLCVDVVFRIGSDFARVPNPGILAEKRPRVDNELFRAFAAAIQALAANGHAALAADAAHAARWLMNSGSIARSRLNGFAEGVRDYPYLVRILRDEDSLSMPSFVDQSPWGDEVPEPDPATRNW